MKHSKIWLPGVIGVLALGVGILLGQFLLRPPPETPEIAGIFLPESRPIDAFELVDHTGSSFGADRFEGKWTFIYFGYTYCPDVCPLSLVDLNQVQKRLAEAGMDEDNAYMMVSVDPVRDRPERLGEYVTYFNPKFQGATGEPEELDRLTRQFGAVYRVPEAPEDDSYLVDHSSTITLINPEGELQAIFTAPHKPDDVVAGFKKIREYYETVSS